MGEHNRIRKPQSVDWRAIGNRTAACGAVGLLIAGAALAVGVVRILMMVVRGRAVGMDGFTVGITLYAAGFAVAGAVVGLLSPWRRDLIGRFVLGILAAAIVAAFIVRASDGPLSRWGAEQARTILVMATIFGLPLGWQLGKHR